MAPIRSSNTVACGLCGKTISRKADLPRHMRTHAQNKQELMHACPYEGCGYKSLQRSNVATHMNTHTGARPNKCPTDGCDYTTSDPGSLTRHRKTMHGYDPKANAESHASASARKAARRQRKPSPSSSSPSPSSSSASSPSPSDSSSDLFDFSLPELDCMLDLCPPFSLSPEVGVEETVKNTSPAYSSALIPQLPTLPTSTSPFVAPSPEQIFFLPFNSELLPSPEAPWVECPQLPTYEQESLYTVNLAADPFCEISLTDAASMPPVDFSNAVLDKFLEQFSDWHIEAGSALAATPHTIEKTAYACSSEALSFDPRWSQYCSFAAPAMGFLPEAVDSTYLHTGPSETPFVVNGLLVC